MGRLPGSERNSEDDSAFHFLLLDAAGKALACDGLHLTVPDEAQARFMTVEEHARGCGYGTRIFDALEAEGRGRGARKIVLNARDNGRGILPKTRLRGHWRGGNAIWRDSACVRMASCYHKTAFFMVVADVITLD